MAGHPRIGFGEVSGTVLPPGSWAVPLPQNAKNGPMPAAVF